MTVVCSDSFVDLVHSLVLIILRDFSLSLSLAGVIFPVSCVELFNNHNKCKNVF